MHSDAEQGQQAGTEDQEDDTAFSTGVAPALAIRSYMVMVSGASEPTSISVVLKFSNETRKPTRKARDQRRLQERQRDRGEHAQRGWRRD